MSTSFVLDPGLALNLDLNTASRTDSGNALDPNSNSTLDWALASKLLSHTAQTLDFSNREALTQLKGCQVRGVGDHISRVARYLYSNTMAGRLEAAALAQRDRVMLLEATALYYMETSCLTDGLDG
ncbi:hypothetical protein EVAR_81749_1 [Eumeta japonica]|uniref:Uncharacterized protein n=1 Tax=Eumeta variegata TaxID=151549 RepID=A0A4C1UHH5_EUMVA|nr:hypothetical protein EVAR_81749_1 [Eumeta japonica]